MQHQQAHTYLPMLYTPKHSLPTQVSDKIDPSELVSLIAALNPDNTPGRLAVIVRMGAEKLREKLPVLINAVQQAGQVVAWVSDPVHGNTEDVNGYKTRRYDRIRAEIEAFFDVHEELGTVPGGLHLEMTGENVTECLGGGASIDPEDLSSRYLSHCDPRLNAEQALEIAFYVASRLRQRTWCWSMVCTARCVCCRQGAVDGRAQGGAADGAGDGQLVRRRVMVDCPLPQHNIDVLSALVSIWPLSVCLGHAVTFVPQEQPLHILHHRRPDVTHDGNHIHPHHV